MSAHIDDQPFPTGALIAIGVLLLLSIVMASAARLTDFGATRLEVAPASQSVELVFNDAPGGYIQVEEAGTGREVAMLAPGSHGFVRVVLQGLAFDRGRQEIGPGGTFILSQRSNGSLTLEDTRTKRIVTLEAFGHGNLAVFAELLEKGKKLP